MNFGNGKDILVMPSYVNNICIGSDPNVGGSKEVWRADFCNTYESFIMGFIAKNRVDT